MQCILADDEPLARKGLENFIREIPFLELTDACGSALEVIEILGSKKTDLLFLDIQMPRMTGLDFLKNIPQKPMTIITTAYPNYAVESYELAVMDYLLKPIPFERFVKAVTKAREYHELLHNKAARDSSPDYCFIKCDKTFEKILYNDIIYVEAFVNYVVIHVPGKKFITYLTLKAVEDQLPDGRFLKINKSYLVSVQKIERIEGNEVVLGNTRLQIGRTFKDHVLETLLNDRLMRR